MNCNEKDAEIERLKAESRVSHANWAAKCDTLRARVEELQEAYDKLLDLWKDETEAKDKAICQIQTDVHFTKGIIKQRDTLLGNNSALMNRVEELEVALAGGGPKRVSYLGHATVVKERDELREKLAAAYSMIDHVCAKPVGPAQTALKQPTVVRQTWQVLYDNWSGNIQGAVYAAPGLIGYLRRDHLSDGTVTCTLEGV